MAGCVLESLTETRAGKERSEERERGREGERGRREKDGNTIIRT